MTTALKLVVASHPLKLQLILCSVSLKVSKSIVVWPSPSIQELEVRPLKNHEAVLKIMILKENMEEENNAFWSLFKYLWSFRVH